MAKILVWLGSVDHWVAACQSRDPPSGIMDMAFQDSLVNSICTFRSATLIVSPYVRRPFWL